MEKKKAIIIAVAIAAVMVIIACSVLAVGNSGSKTNPEQEMLSTVEPELESETPVGSESGNEAVGDGSKHGTENASNENANPAGNASNGLDSLEGGNAPADDGGTTMGVTYGQYHAMSSEEQQAWFNSFDSVEAFFAWYNDAKAVYEANNNSFVIEGDTDIDANEVIGGQS